MTRKLVYSGLVIAVAVACCGQAFGQEPPDGGAPVELTCFYECKPGPMVNDTRTWREITTLMLATSHVPTTANMLFFDGRENLIAQASTFLSMDDLDEVNVCATLRRASRQDCLPSKSPCDSSRECCSGFCDTKRTEPVGEGASGFCSDEMGPDPTVLDPTGRRPVPEAGVVKINFEMETPDEPGGTGEPPAHAWVKNLLGKFFVNRDEPFDGRVTGVAKTQCQPGPPGKRVYKTEPVRPVLVENTGERDDMMDCEGASAPMCMGRCTDDDICVLRNGNPAGDGSGSGTEGVGDCVCMPPCSLVGDGPQCSGACPPGLSCEENLAPEGEGGGAGSVCGCVPLDPVVQACLESGGTLTTGLCCKSVEDFPDTCLTGACGCAPDQSHTVRLCDCEPGDCFDATVPGCVPND